jgi:spore coat protein H
MRNFLISLWLLGLPFLAYSQNSFHNKGDILDDSIIHRIEVTINPADFTDILSHVDSNLIKPINAIFTTVGRKDTLQNLGFRIKGNASRYNDKKSYKIIFNEYKKGARYLGFKRVSVNAFWNDPTHLRAHMTTELFHAMKVPVARTSFADLYINEEYQGLYNLVEQVDEAFLKERFGSKKGNLYKCYSPADLQYLGEEPELYQELNKGQNYVLKTNEKEKNYSGLAEFISILYQTPINELEYELERRFNVDSYLAILAIDILIGNWDSQLFSANNFYLYDNPLTGRFEFIPYDFDNTFGIDWMGIDWGKQSIYNWNHHWIMDLSEEELSEYPEEQRQGIEDFIAHFLEPMKRPLYDRILEVKNYREKFEKHLRYIIANYYDTENFRSEIDSHFAMISPSLKADTLDNFTWEQIQISMDHKLDVSVDFGDRVQKFLPYGLKEFISVSSENILRQLDN